MELDTRIQGKRSEIRDALAAHLKVREAVSQMRQRLSELVYNGGVESPHPEPELIQLAKQQIQKLEAEERYAATRFTAISEELAQLHREKYGEWHFTWRGPLL